VFFIGRFKLNSTYEEEFKMKVAEIQDWHIRALEDIKGGENVKFRHKSPRVTEDKKRHKQGKQR